MSEAPTALEVLADAIADVGYWRWWVADLPQRFQVEFGGVQLWNPPTKEDAPPCGVVALRFIEPAAVAFCCRRDAQDLPADWRQALHEDRLEPFTVTHDEFAFDSEALVALLAGEFEPDMLVGDARALAEPAAVNLAFTAGDVGLVVRARELQAVSSGGVIALDDVPDASSRWWDYWREYWQRRDTEAPLPKDYACEVTIPIRGD